ncbi:MAG: efflux RND transporter periplasmic adaptor subunit [Rhodoferax sp.]|nr:efflux RND transporter periplasmic adaptor subunit [Rhodoferax sp.]MDP3651599.1 efflux RND transporter periplasmic adaptor subunit [Rhodoferax sp.]
MNRLTFKPLTLGLIAASLLTLAGLGLFATRSNAADSAKAPVGEASAATATASKPALTVTVTQARSGTLPIKLAANGNVAAWQEAVIGAESNGLRVQDLLVSIGESVKRGQVLATFAAESVQADVALARASLQEATANAAEATANGERTRAVQNTGALSAQQISQYLTAEQTAKARVESAKAALDAQLLRLKHTQVLAPDAGIITARMATVGSVVGAGTEMFRLIRQGRLEWRGEVTSAELGRITAGTSVLVTAPSGAQAKGKVRMVSPTVDAQSRNGTVFVDLPASSMGTSFKSGMFARGEFELGSSGAMTVVQTAVVVRDGFSYVYTVGPDQRVKQRKVQTGRLVGNQVEIVEGVKAEDRLVASGAGFLSEGDLVKVVEASKPNAAAAPAKPAQVATK